MKFNIKNLKYSTVSIGILLILITVLLYKFTLSSFFNKNSQDHHSMLATLVSAQKPIIQDVVDIAEAVGTLRADESVMIRPEIAGKLVSFNFQEGELVKAGDILITLDSEMYKAQLAQAEANFALSKINTWRAEALLKKNFGKKSDRDEATTKLKVNEAQVLFEKARLEKMSLIAPFDGIIGLRKFSLGDYVQVGQDLVNIVKINPIKVDFTLPEIYAPRLKAGQEIELEAPALLNQKFKGKIYAIDPHIDENGRNLSIRAQLENLDLALKPGMFVKVKIILGIRKNSLIIPEEALIPSHDNVSIFKIVDQKAQLIKIKSGLRQKGTLEVLEGIKADDLIITAGHNKLIPGMNVRLEKTSGASS
ncbi:MAG: efflux RND transporter periplasmic adaptor subunit [Holosporales bacterium]|nr:efflux RND transporter periplasmic adaptor subunit [Holosporales bacterium]